MEVENQIKREEIYSGLPEFSIQEKVLLFVRPTFFLSVDSNGKSSAPIECRFTFPS